MELLDDVWLGLTSDHLAGPNEALSFASTCRRFRAIALPLIYRRVTLRNFVSHTTPGLASSCIDYFLQNAEIGHYVQEVVLVGWKHHRHGAWRSTHKAAISLLLALPNLRCLRLINSQITPDLYPVLCTHSTLVTLDMVRCRRTRTPLFSDQRPPLHLRELSYSSALLFESLPSLINSLLCMMASTLTSLAIQVHHVPPVLEIIGSNHDFTALQKLVLMPETTNHSSVMVTYSQTVCDLLRLCPELRSLEFYPACGVKLDTLDYGAIPHLKYLQADSAIIYTLVAGRAVQNIDVCTPFDDFLEPSSQRYNPPAALSGFFSATGLSQPCLEQMQKNITNLSLTMWNYLRDNNLPLNQLMIIILDATSSWSQLRFLHMKFLPRGHEHYPRNTFWNNAIKNEVHPSGDLNIRNHPSLEEICVNGYLSWLWFPGEGWVLREQD